MSDFHDQDDEFAVVDLAQYAIVANSIAPELAELPANRLADLARVFGIPNSLVEESDYALAGLRSEFAQLL